MRTCSYERIYNFIQRNPQTLVFINGNRDISTTKDVSAYDSLVKHDTLSDLRNPYRIVGVYDPRCQVEHIEEDLRYMGYMDK